MLPRASSSGNLWFGGLLSEKELRVEARAGRLLCCPLRNVRPVGGIGLREDLLQTLHERSSTIENETARGRSHFEGQGAGVLNFFGMGMQDRVRFNLF